MDPVETLATSYMNPPFPGSLKLPRLRRNPFVLIVVVVVSSLATSYLCQPTGMASYTEAMPCLVRPGRLLVRRKDYYSTGFPQ